MRQKIKSLFIPFVVVSVGFIGLYTFFNWLLFIKLDLLPLRQEVKDFGLPVFFCWLTIVFCLKPRLQLLNLTNKKGEDRSFFYQMVALGLIAIPAIIAQQYLITASGTLTQLDSISAIDKQEKSKFYTVGHYFVAKQGFGAHTAMETTEKNRSLRVQLFLALPMYETRYSPAKLPAAWLGLKYTTEINNRLSDDEKQNKLEAFLKESEADFNKRDVQQFAYLDRIGSSDNLNNYQEAIKTSPVFHSASENILLVPENTPYSEKNGTKLFWLCTTMALSTAVWLVLLRKPQLHEENLKAFQIGGIKQKSEWREILEFVVPRKDFFVTPILINLNVIVFLLLFFSGAGFFALSTKALLQWGANYGPAIGEGEYIRLLASTFLHGGFLHLSCNIFGLAYIGLFLEPLLGSFRLAVAYVATGICASLASVYWQDAAISVGASGAIMGLYGVLIGIIITRQIPKELCDHLWPFASVYVVMNLLMGFFTPGVDNAAHLGGLVCGVVLAAIGLVRVRLKIDGVLWE